MVVAGAALGILPLGAVLRDGHDTANSLIGDLGFTPTSKDAPHAADEASSSAAFRHVGESRHRAWLDLQNDVAVKDVKQAYREGFKSVELLKRYTTVAMATDQGKTANIPALAVMAECTGKTIPETGTTIFRPPFTPIPHLVLGRAGL